MIVEFVDIDGDPLAVRLDAIFGVCIQLGAVTLITDHGNWRLSGTFNKNVMLWAEVLASQNT